MRVGHTRVDPAGARGDFFGNGEDGLQRAVREIPVEQRAPGVVDRVHGERDSADLAVRVKCGASGTLLS